MHSSTGRGTLESSRANVSIDTNVKVDTDVNGLTFVGLQLPPQQRK